MKHAFAALALAVTAGCNGAQEVPPEGAPLAAAASGDVFGTDVHLSPSKPDAVLRYADHPRGFAELRLPQGAGPFPLALIYHGGCWKTSIANQAYMAPLATRWQQQGIATLNIDYREVGDGGGWPETFADWQASSRLIQTVAARYPIDRERITLAGHSAGATAAVWLPMAQAADGPSGARSGLRVHGVIVLDGVADVGREQPQFDDLCGFAAVTPFMGGTAAEVPLRYAAISPMHHAVSAIEMLFVQAVLPVPPDDVLGALRASGARVEGIANPEASHFEILTPGGETYNRIEPAMLRVLRGR